MLDTAAGLRERGHDARLAARPGSVLAANAPARGIPLFTIEMRGDVDPLAITQFAGVLRRFGFRRVLIVNGHGGNQPAGALAIEYMADHSEMRIRFHNWWNAPRTMAKVQEIDKVASHASWMENFPWTRLAGVAQIPEDRLTNGAAIEATIADNLVVDRYGQLHFTKRGMLNPARIREQARALVRQFDIRAAGVDAPMGSLSGGNMQKVIVAREFSANPSLLIAAQPTRGVDIGASEFLRGQLMAKRSEGKAFVVVDAGMNDLIRPTLYDAHHDIRPVREPPSGAPRLVADVVGPVCESGDFLALDRDMAEPRAGELIAVMTAGAYGAVQAGTYNTRALVPEVLVREGEWALVRPRVEVGDLIALDRLPPWL